MIFTLSKKRLQYFVISLLMLLVLASAFAFVLQHYNMSQKAAVLCSTASVLTIALSFLLLENILRYFRPSKMQVGMMFLITLLTCSGTIIISDWLIHSTRLLTPNDISIWEMSLPIRTLILLLLFGYYTLTILLRQKIESQVESQQRTALLKDMAKEAELYHLKQQLQPHFLFNSLNSVNALIGKDPEKARAMTLQLSEFLRETIRKDDKNWISVTEEAAYLRLFLDIEQIRFGHRLSVDFHIDDTANDKSLPPLLVQPLLENAVKHGLYGTLDQVRIAVHFEYIPSYLIILISNPYDPEAGQAKGAGFGLESIRRRLYLIFGRYDLLTIQKEEKLFTITLKIPTK